MVCNFSLCPIHIPTFRHWWIVPLLLIISAKRWRLRRGGFRDRPLEVILVPALILSKASSRGTRGHLISGITTRTSSVHRTDSIMAINVPNSRVASRHHARERLTTLLWRPMHLAPPTYAIIVEKLGIMLTIAPGSRISRHPRVSIVIRREHCRSQHPTQERWTMCLPRWRLLNQKSCSIRSMLTQPLPLFFFILELHIHSYRKHLLEIIAYHNVPWKIPY